MTATSSRLVFASSDRLIVTDHDGRLLNDVRPAHGVYSALSAGDDVYFLGCERHPSYSDEKGTSTVWLTRLTATGETSSELVSTFSGIADFGLTAGGGRFLLSISRRIGDREEIRGLFITPGASTPSSPEPFPLIIRETLTGRVGGTIGWDGHEFGIATCDLIGGRLEAALTRVAPDGKTSGPDVIPSASDFCPTASWTAGGKTTLLGRGDAAGNHVVAISAPSFAAMAHEKRAPESFLTAAVVPIQHSVAFAGKLAVWSEGGEFDTAIRARFLPDGRPFTIARRERFYRSAAAAVATRNGYVIAWRESDNGGSVPRVVFQQLDTKGALPKRREVPGGPFDVVTWIKPAIAYSGETIALVSTGIEDRYTLRVRLFDSTLEQVSTSAISETDTAKPIVLASFATVVPPPPPAEGVVVWNGGRYVVTWLSNNRLDDNVHYAVVDERGAAGKAVTVPDMKWMTLQTTTRSSDVVAAGTTFRPPEWKVCLAITTMERKTLGPVHCVPDRRTNNLLEEIQPVLFHDLVLITEMRGGNDVLAAPIGTDSDFVCISCTSDSEQRPAATTIDGHTYVAYERTDRTSDNVTRLFFR
ncbi:MAG TPA: hypothetical protein VHU41_01500, partial [Thermoanaerobaculia bacterium]|nr:hypothetical protein [Thermoanaerobaculia bacterium]